MDKPTLVQLIEDYASQVAGAVLDNIGAGNGAYADSRDVVQGELYAAIDELYEQIYVPHTLSLNLYHKDDRLYQSIDHAVDFTSIGRKLYVDHSLNETKITLLDPGDYYHVSAD